MAIVRRVKRPLEAKPKFLAILRGMKKLIGAFFIFSASAWAQESPVGRWKTIDDETKEAKSIVEISEGTDGKLVGKIVQLFKKPEEDQNPKCDKCKDERKDQPILGMTFLWDMEKRSSDWGNGNILDPQNGKTYSAKIQVVDGGKRLKVRGFIGISLLGRTQYWEKQ